MAPIAAAHLYMLEPGPGQYESEKASFDFIPEQTWNKIRFDVVDFLYVSPFVVNIATGAFELDDPAVRGKNNGETCTLERRLQWVIQRARQKNPNIKILAQQFWDGQDLQDLKEDKFDHYAECVQGIVRKYGLDGYEIDYEWRKHATCLPSGNVVPYASTVLQKIRDKLNVLGKDMGKQMYVTISAASAMYFDKKMADAVDFVNIQSYDGGYLLSVSDFTAVGVPKEKLLYGIWSEKVKDGFRETSRSHSVDEVKAAYRDGQLAGIHNWRLNSHNLDFENKVQALVYDFLHSTHSDGYDETEVYKDWKEHRWDWATMKERGEVH